jgi:hypothetical protein
MFVVYKADVPSLIPAYYQNGETQNLLTMFVVVICGYQDFSSA